MTHALATAEGILASSSSPTMSDGVRMALLVLMALLLVILGCIIAVAFVMRRRDRLHASVARSGDQPGEPSADHRDGDAVRHRQWEDTAKIKRPVRRVHRVRMDRDERGMDRASSAVADLVDGPELSAFSDHIQDPMACPACRREFEPALVYCPYDATKLVLASQMLSRVLDTRKSSRVCATCRRAFDGTLRHCPHDGSDLVPMAVYQAMCDHEHDSDSHSAGAKMCPQCQGRYEYGATFCGKDGMELVVVN